MWSVCTVGGDWETHHDHLAYVGYEVGYPDDDFDELELQEVLHSCLLLAACHLYSRCSTVIVLYRVPMPSGKSRTFLDNFQDLESPESEKSWKFKLKILDSPGICWDTDAMMRTWAQKYSHLHTSSFHDLTAIKHFSSLHVTVMNIAIWMLLSCSYM